MMFRMQTFLVTGITLAEMQKLHTQLSDKGNIMIAEKTTLQAKEEKNIMIAEKEDPQSQSTLKEKQEKAVICPRCKKSPCTCE